MASNTAPLKPTANRVNMTKLISSWALTFGRPGDLLSNPLPITLKTPYHIIPLPQIPITGVRKLRCLHPRALLAGKNLAPSPCRRPERTDLILPLRRDVHTLVPLPRL